MNKKYSDNNFDVFFKITRINIFYQEKWFSKFYYHLKSNYLIENYSNRHIHHHNF